MDARIDITKKRWALYLALVVIALCAITAIALSTAGNNSDAGKSDNEWLAPIIVLLIGLAIGGALLALYACGGFVTFLVIETCKCALSPSARGLHHLRRRVGVNSYARMRSG